MHRPTGRRPTGAVILCLVLIATLGACRDKETGPDPMASAAVPVVAPPPVPVGKVPPTLHPITEFASLDPDDDGRVPSADYARAAQTMFTMMDMSRDGNVTPAEMQATHKVMGDVDGLGEVALFAVADTDKDGKLTLSEWMAFNNARFDRIDTNDDGVIDRAEWDAPHPGPSGG